jgi:hypothetical protein
VESPVHPRGNGADQLSGISTIGENPSSPSVAEGEKNLSKAGFEPVANQMHSTANESALDMTASELLMRNFNEIFIELDPVKRAALLAESFAEDCLWIHPGGRVEGREGINAVASEIRKHFPDYRYTVTGEIQSMHNVATCRWGSGMPGQPFHYTGTDFLEERAGRVLRLYTFINDKPPF